MELTTEARVAQLVLPGAAPNQDEQIPLFRQLILAVSAQVEKFLGRDVQKRTLTEYLTVSSYQRVFHLRAYPVTSVTSVSFDPDQEFAADTALDAGDDFLSPALDQSGLLTIRSDLWVGSEPARNALRVVYVGGMAADVESFVTLYPDIAGAVDQQVAFNYHRRNSNGMQSLASEMGSVIVQEPPMPGILSSVRSVLERHRRVVIGA